jgi:rare lipoprotein A
MRSQMPKTPVKTASAIAVLGLVLAGCSTSQPKFGYSQTEGVYAANGKTSGAEYFSVASVGVSASPRVATGAVMPRGGGTSKVGKPYTVAGKTYYPTENPKGAEVGLASWYGAAFHGRKTANGEIYDMAHLTAAHKTFPLPSYARVTNLENGRSLLVRVNDRGPFAHDRVIDLSKRAADLLDYTNSGVAKVKVEYAGRAPLDGQDDAFLLASVQGVPGNAPDGRYIQPSSGVMVAMNGQTPERRPVQKRGLMGVLSSAFGLPTPRRDVAQVADRMEPAASSAYADQRVASAFADNPFSGLTSSDWKSR